MAKDTNQNQKFIYLRSTREKVPVTDAQYHAFYSEACRIRKREQYHGRCMCPKRYIWACDGDCLVCQYHAAGDTLSLDAPCGDSNSNLGDYMPDEAPSMEDIIADHLLLEQLFNRLRELDSDADAIIKCWLENDKMSDRAIAERLGRKQRTFSDQMKRIRAELRKLLGR
jgi:DNA-directed RNA polymerase specialized sigma24 family protein